MLDAGRAPQLIEGVTVFYDHADEHRRYLLSDVPRLVANPTPQLSLLIFRGSEGGALLQFESFLAPTKTQITAVEKALTASGRKPTLARPDWRGGSVQLAGWLQTTELAPKLLFVGAPSLVGDPSAVVAARLDAHGAALADAALRGNALPTVVIFALDMLGLAGPLSVKVEADLHALHDRLTAEGALTTPYGRARIAKTWETALRDNLIRVTILDESGEFESQRAEAMRRVGEDLLARMFSPFPPPEKPRMLDDKTVAALELSFRLTMRREELASSATWDFRERRPVAIRHYASASLIDLLGSSPADRHISFVDLRTTTREIVVRVEQELEHLGVSAVEVDLRSASGGVAQTVTLTDDQPEVRLPPVPGGVAVEYRVRARFDPAVTHATTQQTDWMPTDGTLVVVSARRLFPPRSVSVIVGRGELDWLDHVEVVIRVPDEPTRSLILNEHTQSAEALLPAAGATHTTIETTWRGRRDEPTLSEPPRELADDLVVIDSPFGDSLNVLVVPLPHPDVVTVIVELRVVNGNFTHAKTVSWDLPNREARRAGLRRLAGSPRRYAYRVQLIHMDQTIEQKPWTETEDTTLVVGADGPVEVRHVNVELLGGGPTARGSIAIELTLESGEISTTTLIDGDHDSATLVLVVPQGAPPLVLTAHEFFASGEIRESRWANPDELTVIGPLPIHTP